MNKIQINIFIKSMLLNKPQNIIYIKNKVNKYEDVIKKFNEFKSKKKWFDYEICSIFNYFINSNNHIIMYHSGKKENSLLMIKYENNYYYYKFPYLIINNKMNKLKNISFIAYYN
tara:strand:+ start:876 stop:1220 length:345 start_codon:yes stop_codon:yes gene_type:complete